MLVAGEDGITGQRLMAMLNGLERMSRGEAAPSWLRPSSGP
jgi:hypothetical protein